MISRVSFVRCNLLETMTRLIIGICNVLFFTLQVKHSRTDLRDSVYILFNINPSEDKTGIKIRYLDSLRQQTDVSTWEVST